MESEETPIRTWYHERKGTIRGRLHPHQPSSAEWTNIILAGDHNNLSLFDGDELAVATIYLKEQK